MASNILTGIAIEGAGFDSNKSDGLFIYHGLHTISGSTNREAIAGLVSLPDGTSTRINPYTGDVSTNALSFVLSASDRLAQLFLSEQRRATIALEADLDYGDVVVTLPTGLDNTIVWIGDETLLLGTRSGSNYPCTRAYYGSVKQTHVSGADVFTRIPGWEDRLLTLIEYNTDDDTEEVVGRYHIDDIDMDGPLITITTSEVLTKWRGAEINNESFNLVDLGKRLQLQTGGSVTGTIVGYTPRVTPDNTILYMEINGEGINAFRHSNSILKSNGAGTWLGDPMRARGFEDGEITEAYEIFAIERTSGSGSTVQGTFSTSDLTYPAHPLAIALALLTSTGYGYNGAYDVLGASWGLGLDYIAFTAWTSQITANPDMVIDGFVLGRGGEAVNVFGVIQDQLLRPFGYFLSITNSGLVAVERLRLPTVIDWDGAQDSTIDSYIDGPLMLSKGLSETTERITASVGGQLGDEQNVVIKTPARSTRRGKLSDAREMHYDFNTISRNRLGLVGDDLTGNVANALINLLELNLDAVPRLFIRVGNPTATGEADYNHGRIIRINTLSNLQEAWVVNSAGVRVLDTSTVDFGGMIIGRDYDIQTRTYTLELLFLSYHVGAYIRLRAPSGLITDSNSSEKLIRLDADTFSDADVEMFSEGDQFEVWTSVGAKWTDSAAKTIDSISGNDLILDTWFASDPAVGYIVRLANSTDYDNDSIYDVTNRPYTYLADDADEIDVDAASNDPADIYGTSIYGGETNTVDGLGSTFLGIDDETFDTTGADCPPLDTWLEHRLRSNARLIIESGHQISWTPTTGEADDISEEQTIRPYASINKSSIMMIPWVVEPDLDQIKCSAIARVHTEGASTSFYLAQLELKSSKFNYVGTEAFTDTDSSTPPFQPKEVAVSLSLRQTSREIAPLILWGTSQGGATDGTSLGAGSITGPYLDTDSNFYQDTGAARPNDNAMDLQYSVSGDVGSQTNMDHLYVGGVNDQRVAPYPLPNNASTLARTQLSYLQLRGLEFHQTFNDTTSPARSILEGKRPVLGEVEAMHSIRYNAVKNRIRPLWVGPVGTPQDPETSQYPTGYHERFYRFGGDSTGTIEATVLPSTDNPVLLCLLYVVPSYDLKYGGQNISEAAIDSSWNIYANVEEVRSGETWLTASEIGSSYENPDDKIVPDFSLDAYPFDATGKNPFLLQEGFISDDVLALKEGQLFEHDLQFVQTMETSVALTRDASDVRPCRVSIKMDYATDFDGPYYDYFNDSNTPFDTSDIYLTVIGASIWEVPS